jgi:hypothetical protein
MLAAMLITFVLIAWLCSCTVVTANRVFPKIVPYWSDDAKYQRQEDADYEKMFGRKKP